ncbi:MAG: SLC13 family permease [Candidatus Nitrosocaldus sp.]|nr:SLC13 family permease [Candidatus Nitrosocaldus sp.]MDW8275817.1 SLC13 family permease [Candidatus Nitrosocaldus sp.]
MLKTFAYPGVLAGVVIVAASLGLEPLQVASLTIFLGLITGTLMYWRFRLAFALCGIAALMAFGLINTGTLIQFAGFDIILFLVGMMIVIGYLEERHFFEHLIERIVRRVGSNPTRLIVLLMLLAGLFAALVDEVTSILFMTATILHLTSKLRISPIPFVIMIVFATNIGSSATVVGNPVGVLIALRAELTFMDFLRWATPISIAALAVTIPLSLKYFSSDIKKMGQMMESLKSIPNAVNNPGENKSFKLPWILFLGTIASLVAHGPVESLLGLEKNAMLLGTALGAAGVTLFVNRNAAREMVEKRVDWWTLSFFIFLFASVGTLKVTGVTYLIAKALFDASNGNDTILFLLFTLIAGIMTAFMDNILAVATFIPIVHEMEALGVHAYPLWWGLLFGGTLFGNMTVIGSTANIVAVGMLERQKLGHITLVQWIKPGLLVSVPTLLLAILLLYIQFPLMPR